jgi:hypothetical protein
MRTDPVKKIKTSKADSLAWEKMRMILALVIAFISVFFFFFKILFF